MILRSIIIIVLLILTDLTAQEGVISLFDRPFLGKIKSLRVSESGDEFFAISGNSLVKYSINKERFEQRAYLDFADETILTLELYEYDGNKIIYLFSDKKLYIIKEAISEFNLINTQDLESRLAWMSSAKNKTLIYQSKLFVAFEKSLGVFYLTNPFTPEKFLTMDIDGNCGVMAVYDSLLFVGSMNFHSHRIKVFNINNNFNEVNSIRVVSREEYDIPIDNIHVHNDNLVVTAGIKIFDIDISDFDNPDVYETEFRDYTDLYYKQRIIEIKNQRLFFFNDYKEQLEIYLHSDLGEFTLENIYDFDERFWDVQYNENEMNYDLTTIGANGIRVYKISGETSNLEIESELATSYLRDIKVSNDNLYFTDAAEGLVRMKINLDGTLSFLSNYTASARSFTINSMDNSIGYLTDGSYSRGGLYTLDLYDDSKIESLRYWDSGGGAAEFVVHNSTGYLLSTREQSIIIFDISDPTYPRRKQIISMPNIPRAIKFDENDIGFIAVNRFGIVSCDFSDPYQPIMLDTLQLKNNAYSDLVLYKNFLLLLNFHGGLSVINRADPSELVFQFEFDRVSGRSICLFGNYALTSGIGKVSMISLFNLEQIKIVDEFSLAGGWFLLPGPSNIAEDLVVSNGKVYVAGGPTGLYTLSIDSTLVSSRDPQELVSILSLSQNYPNPFNPTTRIKFSLPFIDIGHGTSQHTKLVVYDILGREIQTLINKQMHPGDHEVTFDASNFPSGVYLYRLINGNYSATKKMLLMK